jgi:hypothetical protein
LFVCMPCRPHTQESCMRNRLRIRCDTVMHLTAKVDILRVEARQDFLDKSETRNFRTVLDQNLHSRGLLKILQQAGELFF